MEALQRNVLANKLASIWHISDTEDEDKKSCVSVRNVRPLVMNVIRTSPEISSDDIWNIISDDGGDCELEDLYYGSTLEEDLGSAERFSSKAGEVSASTFVNSDMHNLEIEYFNCCCNELATALSVSNSTPQQWDYAHCEGMTPLEAVSQFLK